ncbi:MAG: MG2 domain-containing protein [Prevotella sp.]|nr:MG2 domain-containing protein [Prevotella sp.]
MKKIVIILIAILVAAPASLSADSFKKLWNNVEDATEKDLPRTQLECLQLIIDKATTEASYGNLLKAEMQMLSVLSTISTDSLQPHIKQLEDEVTRYEADDPALAAVLNTVLGRLYTDNPSLAVDAKEKAAEYFKKAMADPEMLAKKKALKYEPFVVKGRDSRYFSNDLLSLLGQETQDYETMCGYYNTTTNRPAAMFSSLWLLEKRNMDNVYSFPYSLRRSAYLVALDSLINVYKDLKACGEVAVERYNYMSKCNGVTIENRVAYINNAVSKWKDWKSINVLRNELKQITRPSLSANMNNKVSFSGTPAVLRLSVRNIEEVKVTVSRLSVNGDTELNPDNDNDYKTLKRLVNDLAVTSNTKQYIGQPDYLTFEDSIQLSTLPVGVYLIEVTANNNSTKPVRNLLLNTKPVRTLLYVTDMYVLHQQLPGNMTRIAVVNAITGQPVPHASVNLKLNSGKSETISCDENGEYMFSFGSSAISSMRAFTATDKAAPFTYAWNSFSYYENKSDKDILNLFTDRKIYRPGQTVHVAAVLLNNMKGIDTKAIAGKEFSLSLKNANGKVIKEQTVTTDNFGTASTDFDLPSSGLTGTYSVVAGNGVSGNTFIKVEEYKRPTFMVEFPEINSKYQIGDTLVVTAHATTYSGVPVQNAKVKYTVKRSQPLWWRLYSSTASSEIEILTSGQATTDNEGAFQIEMPMTLPEGSEKVNQIKPNVRATRIYTITATADVTDQAGETHSGELALILANKPTAFSCDLPDKILRDSLNSITFMFKNAAGANIDGIVRYYIDGAFNPFTARTNVPTEIDWNTPTLRSGKHTLMAYCEGDTLRKEFVVFGINDRKPCVETHDWFYISDNMFPRDGSPVYVQVGSSDSNVHVFYTAMSGNEVIESGIINISNEIKIQQLTYDEKYGSGLLFNVAWVKDGTMYTHNFKIQRPLPDKKLNLQWATFRDRLTPGQKEEWTLTVTKPDGTPANAQLLVTLYDASLDAIMPLKWTFNDNIMQTLPSSVWKNLVYGKLSMYFSTQPRMLNVEQLVFNTMNIGSLTQVYYGASPLKMTRMKNLNVIDETADMNVEAPMATGETTTEVKSSADMADSSSTTTSTQVQLRENLSETAFFYPALLTDSKGNVSIKFTLPESLTSWRFIGIAHDQEMNHGQISTETVARKIVMVQPNIPRFIRTGDKATIATKLINTSEKRTDGKVTLQITNSENNNVIYEQTKNFTVNANSTTNISFDYTPTGEHPLLVCKISASGKDFIDGEQHYLPILPNTETVMNTIPFTQHEPGIKNIDLSSLFPSGSKNGKLTVEYTNNPAWLIIQALPYIADAKDDNAISLAAAYYANSIGSYIINASPRIKEVFNQWKNEERQESLISSLEKNQELKSMVIEETPWLADATGESEQKQRIANFFDETTLSDNLNNTLQKLSMLQDSNDGSFHWWKGSPTGSPQLTATILELLSRLNMMTGTQSETSDIMNKAKAYLEKRMVEDAEKAKKMEEEGSPNYTNYDYVVHLIYCYALNREKPSEDVSRSGDYLIEKYLESGDGHKLLYDMAMIAVCEARISDNNDATNILKSLEEYSVASEEMGRYYDSPLATYNWLDYHIPTQVAVIEAMTLIDSVGYAKTIEEMKQWLLQQKKVQGWNTPINSVNAIFTFLNGNMSLLDEQENTVLSIDGKPLDLPSATAGLGYVKTSMTTDMARTLTAIKKSEGTSWGAVYVQNTQNTDAISNSSSGFTITREIVASDGAPTGTLKIGDRVKVRITIKADRDYDFVQVTDKRAACLEPVGQMSGYHNGYYQAQKDCNVNYYFDSMAKGTHVIESEFYVDRCGQYETGSCTVQCAYSPEYSATAPSQIVKVE